MTVPGVGTSRLTHFFSLRCKDSAIRIGHASLRPGDLGHVRLDLPGRGETYFIYGARDPHWGNAVGQLAGFLAYDLVLLAPFLEHFSAARGGSLVSLIIYVAFLVYSGALASYYLFASNAT